MNNKDIQLRGGHKLKHISGDLWEFVPKEDWMPIQVILNDDHSGYICIDCDSMGMPLMIGNTIGKYKITNMFDPPIDLLPTTNHIIVGLKLIEKENIEDLERGDILYVVTPDYYLGARLQVYIVNNVDEGNNIFLEYYNIQVNHNKNDLRMFIVDKEQLNVKVDNENTPKLNSKEGIKTCPITDGDNEKIFSNKNFAQKYAYDLIQNKIQTLKEQQRKLMQL